MSPWPKGDPRATLMPAEQIAAIKKLSVAQLKTFHKAFVGGGHAELAIVGDFDQTTVSTQVEKLFGTWTSKKPYARLGDKPFGVAGGFKTVDIKDKENTVVFGGHDLAMRDTDADYAAWLLVGHVLGGDQGSRLWMRIREGEGLSYGVAAWTSADALDDSGSVGLYMIVAPQNLAKARAAMVEEITKLATSGVTEAELTRAKASWIQGEDTALSSDSYVAGTLNELTYQTRTFENTQQLRKRIQAVTVADIARVAKARLQPDKLVIIDAGDSSKAK
jgi:zinc protease